MAIAHGALSPGRLGTVAAELVQLSPRPMPLAAARAPFRRCLHAAAALFWPQHPWQPARHSELRPPGALTSKSPLAVASR